MYIKRIALLLVILASVLILKPEPIKEVKKENIIKDRIEIYLDRLSSYEGCPDEGMIDSNGLKSYGPLCFQIITFYEYALKYNVFPNAEYAEIENFLDKTGEFMVARAMLEHDPKLVIKWKNSVYKGNGGRPPLGEL